MNVNLPRSQLATRFRVDMLGGYAEGYERLRNSHYRRPHRQDIYLDAPGAIWVPVDWRVGWTNKSKRSHLGNGRLPKSPSRRSGADAEVRSGICAHSTGGSVLTVVSAAVVHNAHKVVCHSNITKFIRWNEAARTILLQHAPNEAL